MIKILNYILLFLIFILNTSLAETINVFEFTEKELSAALTKSKADVLTKSKT